MSSDKLAVWTQTVGYLHSTSSHHSSPLRSSCREGRGKKVFVMEGGRSRGNGRSKTSGRKTKSVLPEMILNERKPWLAPTEFCASDEAEGDEDKPTRVPPGQSDPVGADVERRNSRNESRGCQSGVTEKAVSHLHPRYIHMKDERPFEGIRTSKRQAEGPDAPLHSELERRIKERQSNKLRGLQSRDFTQRSRVALP